MQCTVDGCEKPYMQAGYCSMHYTRQYRHGDPLWEPPTESERFLSKINHDGPVVRPDLGPCAVWTCGTFNKGGYGQFSVNGSPVGAHVYAWQIANGPVPKGMCVCHHCDNPPCVRLDHLWLGTNIENLADMVVKGRQRSGGGRDQAAKTHCPAGHEYSSENTYVYDGRRFCRRCRREKGRIYDRIRRPPKRAA